MESYFCIKCKLHLISIPKDDGNYQMDSLLPAECISHITYPSQPLVLVMHADPPWSLLLLGLLPSSNAVWENFLPPDYEDFISQSSSLNLLSKKGLYLHLCHHPSSSVMAPWYAKVNTSYNLSLLLFFFFNLINHSVRRENWGGWWLIL